MTERPERQSPNKLAHKNRWLISADVVAALRRAGVECNIIVADDDQRTSGDIAHRAEIIKH